MHERVNRPVVDPNADLASLVSRCLDGDSHAITAFVERFERAVFGLCLRMLGDRHEAEDVAQETFVRAVRNLHKWEQDRPLWPWLQTIAANRCRTALGKRQRRPVPVPTIPEPHVSPDLQRELVEEVDFALAELSAKYRQVIHMYYRQDLNCAEIAAAFGCAEGTIKTWLFRARRQLAEILGAHRQEEESN